MRLRFVSLALPFVAGALALVAIPFQLPAQSLTLSPAVVPLAGSLGQSVTQVLRLQNHSDLPLDFVLEARDVVIRDGARTFVEPGEMPDGIAASAVFSPRTLRIDPRSTATAKVTFTLPLATRHRAVVALFRGTSVVRSGERDAYLSLGTLFTFTLSDRLSLAAGALEGSPPSPIAHAALRTAVSNDGPEPVTPSGMAVLLDAHDRLVGKAQFPQRRLLPGEVSTLMAEYPGDLASGTYRAVATFDFGGPPLTLTGSLVVP